MARPISRRVAIAAALLGGTAAAAATVSACGAAQADASPGPGPSPGQSGASPGQSGASPGQSGASPGATESTGKPTPAEVQRAKRQLDDRAERAPSSVTSWGVDPAIGLVVVRVTGGRTPEVERFLAGIDPRTLRVITGSDPVRPLPAPS